MEAQGHSDVDAGSGLSEEARSPRRVPLARWLLLFAAAIGAPLLVFLGLEAIAQRWRPFPAPSWFVLLGFVLLPVSCVVAAALAAPARRRLAALIAASVCTAAALGVSLLVALSGGWSLSVSAGWATVGITLGVAAAYGTAFLFAGAHE